jgi:glucokinase
MAVRYIIAADIGGTNALVELFAEQDGICDTVDSHLFASQAFVTPEALLEEFLKRPAARDIAGRIEAACLSVAGHVENGVSTLTNLGWLVDAAALGARFKIPRFEVINDFAANAAAVPTLGADQLLTLQRGEPDLRGNRLIVGAGTGLGCSFLTWHEGRYAVHGTEAGHIDLAANDVEQDALLAYLRGAFGRVSYERVLSGSGLPRILGFLEATGTGTASADMAEAIRHADAPAVIAQYALGKRDPLAVRTLEMFVSIYGAFAGNLALATLASGGVYIAGGIARRNASAFTEGGFIRAFTNKGRFSALLRRYPVHVVIDARLGVRGAVAYLLQN